MNPNDVVKIILQPSLTSCRITRSASADSGTFSTYTVFTRSPSSRSTCCRPRSCWYVQPTSPIGPG